MDSLADLHRAVEATLADRRLGVPVFVRYVYHRPAQAEAAVADLVRVAAAVRGWLGAPVDGLYALGGFAQQHVSLTVEFRNGATALVTWVGTAGRGAGIDLMVVGNHGTLYHDAGDAALWDEAPAPGAEPPDRELLALVERAVRSGRPERAGAGGQP